MSILRLCVTVAIVWTVCAFGAMLYPQLAAGVCLAVGTYLVVVSAP